MNTRIHVSRREPVGRRDGAPPPAGSPSNRGWQMLWTIAVVLIALWLFGQVTAYTLGGFIHILLVIAVISVAIRLIQGRRLV